MTAISAVIDGSNPDAAPRWRVAWARREDARRRYAYHEAVAAWDRHHEHLLRLRIEAATFEGCHPARDSLPVRFEDDEVVFRVVPTARLVEVPARHVRGLPVPDLTVGASATPLDGRLPRGFRVVAAGAAVITDRRVAFAGPESRREWWYADTTGIAQHPGVPLTLLHTFDCRRLAGLLAEPAGAVNARFYLTLAYATATDRRATVVAEIDALLAEHEATRPNPPAPARPSDAPFTALRPERRFGTAVAAAATLTALTAGFVDAESAERPHRTEVAATLPGTADRPGPAGAAPPAPATPTTAAPVPQAAAREPLPPAARTRHPARVAPEVRPPVRDTVAPAVDASPGGRPTTSPTPGTTPTPTPTPSPSAPPSATPTPTDTPTPATTSLLTVCVGVVELPIVDPLLCPGD
ncbi:hypothetical protein [Micromonospora sp. NPDC126480]|uniref:hypothetical protein n=1 Tax=Micromonospora sp. NPDC126480 TaxID=3155312 RepID=UPI0033315DBE